MNERSRRVMLAVLTGLAGCHRLSDEAAIEVVRSYDRALIEAYRTADPRRIEGVAGEAERRRLTSLIGVKGDMGITLDAQLLDLAPVEVHRDGDDVFVVTRERWYYADRRIGTGEQVGPDSTDRYVMRYRLRRAKGPWVVEGVAWQEPPQVGRKETLGADVKIMHGIDTLNPEQEKAPPSPGSTRPRNGP